MKVLVIEDTPEERFLFTKQLLMLGHEATACESAEEALELYRSTFFPMITLDLGLPGMDGFEFCRQIRDLPQRKKTLILIMTGRDKPNDIKSALEAGADDYLIKPISFSLLQVRLLVIEQQLQRLEAYNQVQEELQHTDQNIQPPSGEFHLTVPLSTTNFDQASDVFEKQFLLAILDQCGWDKAKTAVQLDIPERTLLRKMKKYQLFSLNPRFK